MTCDLKTGVCSMPDTGTSDNTIQFRVVQHRIQILYFTDPICSSCWGIEPQLRKLKLEYGEYFDIEYRMGGLLQGWDVYAGKDVNGPASVAKHWDDASAYYGMPIDGDLWLEDPLHSSYPPSVAFKAAQCQGTESGLRFLRRIKEMVFLEKKNITRWENLAQAAVETGLDGKQFRDDFESRAGSLFEEDLTLAKQLGVKGFPSIFFTDQSGNRLLVYGVKSYAHYEEALLTLYPQAVKKRIAGDWQDLFNHFPTLTAKEYSVLLDIPVEDAIKELEELYRQRKLGRHTTKNGNLWFTPNFRKIEI